MRKSLAIAASAAALLALGLTGCSSAASGTAAAGKDVTCVQVAGLIARRILCYVKAGDRLARGQRYGFIRFGSRVDVYLPPGSVPKVAIGDIVAASSTVLAELPRP